MTKKYKTPWEVGSLFICTKCAAKFTQENLAEELKTELRKNLKKHDQQNSIRVMISGCLNVCHPEEQTFAFMPANGPTEVQTTVLDKETALNDIQSFIKTKIENS